jgi:heme ABC exporter ATP-binding subunit CcmA
VNPPLIEATGLEKRFGAVPALSDLDLRVNAGCVLAILGPNGAGKSTLLRVIAGLARPTRGSLRVGSGDEDRRRARRRIGYVGHATLLYPALTARENLSFAGRLQGLADADAAADSALAEHGLSDLASRPAGALSQGQSRRLSIARGLVHGPEIVLLDEPFSGLDRAAAGRLAEHLRALRSAERTLLLVTHDLARAAELADEALVLARGRAVHRTTGRLEAAELERAYLSAVEEARP